MINSSVKRPLRILCSLSFICTSLSLLGSSPIQASSMIQEEERALPLTQRRDLRKNDPTIEDITYQSGSFSSSYDDLAKISSTPCHQGKGKTSIREIPPKSEVVPISGIKVEDGKCKIVEASDHAVEQKSSFENRERRTRISHPTTQEWPYRVQGHMVMKFPSGPKDPDDLYTGSGILVGPHHVLTAGHNLYNPDNKKWAKEVLFAPGRDEGHYPYGDSKGCILLVHDEWHKNSKQKNDYDFGMVILDSSIGTLTGWSGLLSLHSTLLKEWPISVTGYPGDHGTDIYHSTQQWTMKDTITKVEKEKLFYEIQTYEGQSGSGVWGEKWPGLEGMYTIGIHTGKETEEASENRGIRLSQDKFKIILEWIKAYQLPSFSSVSSSLKEEPITFGSLTFLQDLDQHPAYGSWVKRARGEDGEALYHLGSLYEQGEDIQKDEYKAHVCFILAAQKGYGPALTALGSRYETGKGIEKHPLKAVSLYQQARLKKNAEAMRRLGLLYLQGTILPKKPETAISLLREAIAQGDAEACYHLAQLYDKGELITQDQSLSAQLYQQAQKLGYKLPSQAETFIEALSDEEVSSSAFKKIFEASLKRIKESSLLQQQPSNLTLFICYDAEDKASSKEAGALALDLYNSGLLERNIYYDKWANNMSIYQHADRIFKADKVLLIGSQGLKEKYERNEGGRGISSHQIENLLTRITQKGDRGIIPVWFKGRQEESFPQSLQKFKNITQYFLGGDYFAKFFSVLKKIHDVSLTNNPIKDSKEEFKRKRKALISSKLLEGYGKSLNEKRKKQHEDDLNDLKNILGI